MKKLLIYLLLLLPTISLCQSDPNKTPVSTPNVPTKSYFIYRYMIGVAPIDAEKVFLVDSNAMIHLLSTNIFIDSLLHGATAGDPYYLMNIDSSSGKLGVSRWNTLPFDWNNVVNAPSIPSAQVSSDWNSIISPTSVLNKPTIPSNTNQLTNGSGFLTSEVDGNITNEIQTISRSNGTVALSNSGGSINLPDSSSTNEIEVASQTSNSGKVLSTNGTTTNWITPFTFAPAIDTLADTRAFNTAYQISTTNYVEVVPSIQITCALSLSGGQSGEIYLEVSTNGSTGWVSKGRLPASNTGSLTLGLNTTQISGGQLSTLLPPTYYYRLRTNNTTGTPTFTMFVGEKRTF